MSSDEDGIVVGSDDLMICPAATCGGTGTDILVWPSRRWEAPGEGAEVDRVVDCEFRSGDNDCVAVRRAG